MKTRIAVVSVIGVLTLSLPQTWGVLPPATEPLANYDRRTESLAASSATAAQVQAAAELKSSLPGLRISRDKLLGTPSFVSAGSGFLTGPEGQGKGVSAAQLAVVPANDSHRVTKAFLNEHSALFGHDAQVLNSARIQRDYVTEHNGLKTTVWEQTLDGIPVYEGLLISHVTRNGELASISSHFVANAAGAANAGNANRSALVQQPTIPVAQAVANAAANINVQLDRNSVAVSGTPQGPEKRQVVSAPGLTGSTHVQLVWLPMNQDTMRLCWRVIVGQTIERYLVLVDAESGDVLVRRGLTAHASPATYNVFTSDSPSPMSPGTPTPNGTQPPLTDRTLVTITAFDTNASPAGWINDGDNQTFGNNADAFLDRNFDGVPDGSRPQGVGPNRVFDYPMDLTNNAPLAYQSASTVQLFYQANLYHDRLYQMGFTEAAGNFQVDNFGRGGFGNDEVRCFVQAGADVGFTDNAAFSTPPDGISGECYMFVFVGPNPDRDGSLDQEVVIHELTHGLSNRLLGGGVGISALQTGGMGEGWSDFYGLCLLSESSDDPDGVYAAGGYASYLFIRSIIGFDFTDNYYFGIRRYPYSTDMSKNPLTFKDIDPTKASAHLGVPINPIFGGGDPSEVHNQGEVWCMTLREVWANLVDKWGWNVGNRLALQLVTDGLKLAPANANFLEARDGILLADEINNAGENVTELWLGFAKRGMGLSAECPQSDTTIGVIESFDLPPNLSPDGILEVRVTPLSGEVLFVNETNNIFLRVTDGVSITNATIVANVNGTNLTFRNDGVAPDQAANNSIYTARLISPPAPATLTITAVISAPGKLTSTNQFTYFVFGLPPNDNFANAIKAPAAGTNYLTSNKRATKEANEPNHDNVPTATASLWWNYTATANTNIVIDSGGSSFRSVIGVYTNNSLTSLQTVASARGSFTRPGAFVNVSVKSGVTYRIAVAGFDTGSVGTINLIIAPGVQADTNPPTVTVISPLNGTIVTTNRVLVSGTAVDPTPNLSGIKSILLNVSATPFAGGSAVITIPWSSLTGPASSNWSSLVGLQEGRNLIEVSALDYAGNRSQPQVVEVTYRPLDPINDFFINAITITTNTGVSSINTVHATKEVGEPNHAGTLGGKSAWWKFTPSADGVLTLSTTNSTFDTVLGIYTGTNVSHLTTIANNDDAYDGVPGGHSQIIQAVNSNQTYRIAVDGYDGLSGVVFFSYSFVTGKVFQVTLNSTAGGTVSPLSPVTVQSNGMLTVTANPAANYVFDSWDGSVVSLSNPLSFTVTRDMTLTARFRPVSFTDGFESGNLQGLDWITGGNKPWIVQSNVVAVGQFAARSGNIANNQTSSLILTSSFREGNGSFDYMVSSEPGFDQLRFYIDGFLQQQWSGAAGWANYPFNLSTGTHTLEWRYVKDPNGASGLDAAFIDDVNLPIVVPLDGSSPADLTLRRETSGPLFVDLVGQENQRYILQSSTDLFSWQNVSTNVAVGGFVRIQNVGTTNATLFYRAIAAP